MLWCLFWNANLLEGEFVWCVRTWPHQLFMQSFTITKLLVVLYNNLASILPSLACNNCLASRQRQRDNDNATTTTRQRNGPLETRKNVKHFKAWVSKWSSHNECRHNALINSFFYLKTWSHCRVPSSAILPELGTSCDGAIKNRLLSSFDPAPLKPSNVYSILFETKPSPPEKIY